jgi:hypothetical protein
MAVVPGRKFLPDDPISKYLLEFKNPKVFVKPASGEAYTHSKKRLRQSLVRSTIVPLLMAAFFACVLWKPCIWRDAGDRHRPKTVRG